MRVFAPYFQWYRLRQGAGLAAACNPKLVIDLQDAVVLDCRLGNGFDHLEAFVRSNAKRLDTHGRVSSL
ncbi:MAG: hypothetical protein OXK72_04140 [Gammaproteobacteria bacterium]|nr:hypothetical protein [Gammaproteobacteria bacterium]